MTRTLFTIMFTGLTAATAFADPGHLIEAGHGHSHWLGYGILVGIAAVALGKWLARFATKIKAKSV